MTSDDPILNLGVGFWNEADAFSSEANNYENDGKRFLEGTIALENDMVSTSGGGIRCLLSA